MKTTRLLWVALAALLALPMHADDEVPALNIHQMEGESQVELSEILSIKYTDTDMVVNYKDGSQQTFALDDIVVIEFGSMLTAIRNLIDSGSLADGKQPKDNYSYTITDLRGKLISRGKAKSKRLISLPTKQGVYLLTVDGHTTKILVK